MPPLFVWLWLISRNNESVLRGDPKTAPRALVAGRPALVAIIIPICKRISVTGIPCRNTGRVTQSWMSKAPGVEWIWIRIGGRAETVHPPRVQIALVETVEHDDIMRVWLKAGDLKAPPRESPSVAEFPQPLAPDTGSRFGVIPHDGGSNQFWGTRRERIGEGLGWAYAD